MSMFDKIKGMMGVPDDDDYDDDDMDFVNENTGYAAQDDYVPEEQDVTPKRNKVVNINSTMQLQVVLVKPERFDDASAIADHLNAKRTVVLNLESTNKEVSRRLPGFPIVLHGSSSVPQEYVKMINDHGGRMPNAIGVPEEQLREAAKLSVCKINIDSDLRLAMTGTIRQFMEEHPDKFDPREYLKPARANIKSEAKRS